VTPYPRWVGHRMDLANLREVGPDLYVGSEFSPEHPPPPGRWSLVVDLYGTWTKGDKERYRRARRVISAPFQDGTPIPAGFLDRILQEVLTARPLGPVLVHCQAGFSRSPSVAYALLRVMDGLDPHTALARARMPETPEYPMPRTLAAARQWADRQQRVR